MLKKGNIPWNKGLKIDKNKYPAMGFQKGHAKLYKINGRLGKKPWNKELTKETDERVKKNGENAGKTKKLRYSTGEITNWLKDKKIDRDKYPNFGYLKPHTTEMKKKMSQSFKGRHFSPKTEFKEGDLIGEKHPNWRGGYSPYGFEFNKKLKELIRKRDNYTCQECKFTEKQLGYTLSVHHIDFNKKNNEPTNLISLCKSCHTQTSFNRADWTDYFQSKMGI